MALFNKKEEKNETVKAEAPVAKNTVVTSAQPVNTDLSWVLKNPRMSEKAMYASDKNVYVFDLDKRANKRLITDAIKAIYNVTPKKVNVSKIATKKVRNQRTGIRGVKSGGKKAYVYLSEGDKITIV